MARVLVVLAVASCSASQSVMPGPSQATPGNTSAPTPAATFVRPSVPPADASTQVVVDGLDTPVGLVPYPGRAGVEVVWEQTGVARVLEGGSLRPEPFLDLRGRLVALEPSYDERGLLGLAFHPQFATNGRVFVYYSAATRAGRSGDHTDRLSELRVDPADPLRVVKGSEKAVLEFEQPQPNHSGGGLGFGPDGLLYLGTGDGGGTGDASEGHSPQGNAQDPMKLNGKILRIDVDRPGTDGRVYAIPTDNPFADGASGRPEIYAMGLRNPWRLTWEPAGAQRLLVSDVGYGRFEEVDVVTRGGNDGWRVREGAHCLDVAHPLDDLLACPATAADGTPFTDPVVEYTHKEIGIAIVGGFIYQGTALPALAGRYVFADFTEQWVTQVPTGRATILVAEPQASGVWPWRRLSLEDGRIQAFITGIGQEASGELVVLVRDTLGPSVGTGRILRLVPAS
jgi:glucose/arabinose dehydrogenase